MSIVQGVINQVHQYNSLGKVSVVTAPTNKQVALLSARATNASGSTARVGVARKFATPTSTAKPYKLFTYDNSTFTEVTLPLSGATTIVSTTQNHGFGIQAKSRFGIYGFTISQIQGGSPVYEIRYYNGSSFVTLTQVVAQAYTSTGDTIAIFAPPFDWAPGGGSGLDANMYSIRVRATTATSQAIQATDIWVANPLDFAVLTTNSSMSLELSEEHPLILEAGEGIMPFFSVASTSNYVVTSHVTF